MQFIPSLINTTSIGTINHVDQPLNIVKIHFPHISNLDHKIYHYNLLIYHDLIIFNNNVFGKVVVINFAMNKCIYLVPTLTSKIHNIEANVVVFQCLHIVYYAMYQ